MAYSTLPSSAPLRQVKPSRAQRPGRPLSRSRLHLPCGTKDGFVSLRPFFNGLLALASLFAVAAWSADTGSFAGRNVVMLVMDTTRFDHLGLPGYPKDTPPFLDSLAADAVVFDRAYSGSSWTAPSTASIFTSLYPDQHGVTSGCCFYQRVREKEPELRLNRLPSAVETLPEMMRAAGYRNFCAADNANIRERVGFARGFDHFAGTSYAGGEALNIQLGTWKKELRSGEGPFFLYAQDMDAHEPYHEQEPYYQLEGMVAKGFVKGAARYDSELRYLDELLRWLFDEHGLDENTLVKLTADHGEEFGDHGGNGHDGGLYEELVHVLLFVIGRNSCVQLDFEPERVPGMVSTLDLRPTLRELMDQPAAEVAEGRSLAPLRWADPETRALAGREVRTVFSHRTSAAVSRKREYFGIYEIDWQLISDAGSLLPPQLFDLATDPNSELDLACTHPQIRERLLRELKTFQGRPKPIQHESAEPVTLDEAAQAELSRLGYAE